VDLTADQLPSWTPIRVLAGADDLRIDWCHTAGLDFTEPFFDQTVGIALAHPFRLLFRHETTLTEAEGLVADHPGLPIAGFVFHLSRCGSTLVTQMLAAAGQVLALSEPGPLDTVLRKRFTGIPADDDQRVRWFRVVAAALSQPRTPTQRHCVVKLDSWTVLDLTLVRRAFPSVPWIFLHRDPLDVMVSQQRYAGFHMRPGSLEPATLGFADGQRPPDDRTEYRALVLGRFLDAAAEGADDRARFVAYDELPGAVAEVIAPHFGLPLDDTDRAAMADAAIKDAKNPTHVFEPDRHRGRPVDPALAPAVDRWARPAYERVRALDSRRVQP
jgi:gluconate kinase